ncbi:6-bladed beta-propeller [Gemmatimonadota bacterium]
MNTRYLIDPNAADLEEWQYLGRNPWDICWGRPGEIFISDVQNARVLLIDTSGELISVIGRKGDGPGEFRTPWDIAYDRELDHLWVAERGGNFRISIFTRAGDDFQFRNRVQAPSLIASEKPTLLIEDQESFWINNLAQVRYRKVGDEFQLLGGGALTSRVQLMRLDGGQKRAFGDIWEIELGGELYFGFNRGLLERINDQIVFIAMHRPIVEIWSSEGRLIRKRDYSDIGFEVDPPYLESRTLIKAPSSFRASAVLAEENLIYVCWASFGVYSHRILEINASSLEIQREYQVSRGESEDEDFYIWDILAERIGNQVRFFCLNNFDSALAVMEVEEPPG